MSTQGISLVVLRGLISRGILPNNFVDIVDLEILTFLMKNEGCDLECVLELSDEDAKLWRRNFLQIKTAVTNQDNVYFTGIEVHHEPNKTEEVLHFACCGGAEDFSIKEK